ncbi:MAG TPA: hypothetical protein VMZ74_17925 [Ramlibacter sp.]|nr:hypothetical protein [Ramlibacter sp.]
MKREMFFTVTGIVAMLFGIGFVLVPAMSLAMYGVPTEPHNLMQSRYFGSALLAVGIISYLARDTQDPLAWRAILWGGLVMDLIGLGVSFSAAGSLQNEMAWGSVVLYAVFAAGGAYFLFGAKQPAPAAAA